MIPFVQMTAVTTSSTLEALQDSQTGGVSILTIIAFRSWQNGLALGLFQMPVVFDKIFVQNWVTCSASGCNYRVAFFQPSQPLPHESECTSEGMVCLSNLSALWLFGNEWGTNWGAGVVLTHRDNLLKYFVSVVSIGQVGKRRDL
jgi:hypothetical protein